MPSAEIYRSYSTLMAGREADGLGGVLLLVPGLNPQGRELTIAANIAGAATLTVEADPKQARSAIAAGVCDFMVVNLDEALRILKNEIRKRKPVAVALVAQPVQVHAECLERGVQPDLVESAEWADLGGEPLPAQVRAAHPIEVRWSAPPGHSLALKQIDLVAASALGRNAEFRRRWLTFAPRYIGRPMLIEHYVRMEEDEFEGFSREVSALVRAGSIPAVASIQHEREPVAQMPPFHPASAAW